MAGFDLCLAFVRGQGDDLRAALERSGVARSVIWPSHPPPGSHATDHLLGCLGEVGVAARRNRPRLEAQGSWLKAGRARLRSLGLGDDFVAIHPGSGGARKCWPLERFVEVASRLPLPVVWILGPAELERGGFGHVCDRSGCVVANPGLEELAGLLALARGYVGNDSGVSHLAAALGTPTVAVFGPTDPAAWGPRGESVAVLGGPGEGGFEAVDAMRVVAELERLITERRH